MATTTAASELKTAPFTHNLLTRLIAEAFGTFLLVFGVIGTAIFSSHNTGYLGVALAVGLAVLAGAYAFGHISGAHFNPAVTVGLALAKRIGWGDVAPYVGAQVVGGLVASSLLFAIATGGPGGFLADAQEAGFASNGWGEMSPGGFGLLSVILAEVLLTAVLVYVILATTDRRATAGFAPLAIGLTLTLIHLIAIPISNASVNPARSIATAVFGGTDALAQLIVFIVAPVVGAVIAGATYTILFDRKQ